MLESRWGEGGDTHDDRFVKTDVGIEIFVSLTATCMMRRNRSLRPDSKLSTESWEYACGSQSPKITRNWQLRSAVKEGSLALDDLKISSIASFIMLVIALPILIARLIGAPLIPDFTLEASILYLPVVVLVLLTLLQWRRLHQATETPPSPTP